KQSDIQSASKYDGEDCCPVRKALTHRMRFSRRCNHMFNYHGRTALVTGASWGIGTSFVQALAGRGMNVILAARSEDRIRELASDVSGKHQERAETITVDLSREQSADLVREEVERRGLAVDLLVNNAGFATYGHFENLPAKRDHEEIMVNVAAVV